MRSHLLIPVLLLAGCQSPVPISNTPVVNLEKGISASPDTFSSKVEMAYEFKLQIDNGIEDIWFITSSPIGERYAHTTLDISKTINSDSILRYGGIIDRVGHTYKLEANKRKILLVKVQDFVEIDVIPDAIIVYFRYYRDSIHFDMWQMKVSVPVKSQLDNS